MLIQSVFLISHQIRFGHLRISSLDDRWLTLFSTSCTRTSPSLKLFKPCLEAIQTMVALGWQIWLPTSSWHPMQASPLGCSLWSWRGEAVGIAPVKMRSTYAPSATGGDQSIEGHHQRWVVRHHPTVHPHNTAPCPTSPRVEHVPLHLCQVQQLGTTSDCHCTLIN